MNRIAALSMPLATALLFLVSTGCDDVSPTACDCNTGGKVHVISGLLDSSMLEEYSNLTYCHITWDSPVAGSDWSYALFFSSDSVLTDSSGWISADDYVNHTVRVGISLHKITWYPDEVWVMELQNSLVSYWKRYKIILTDPGQ